MSNIKRTFIKMVLDQGRDDAISHFEGWAETISEIADCGSPFEMSVARQLLVPIDECLQGSQNENWMRESLLEELNREDS